MKTATNAPPAIPADLAELVDAIDALPAERREATIGYLTRAVRGMAPKPPRPAQPRRPSPPPDDGPGWIGTLRQGLAEREPVRGLGHPSRVGEAHGLAPKLDEFARLGTTEGEST